MSGEWMCPECKGSGDSGRTSHNESNRPVPCGTCMGRGTVDYNPAPSVQLTRDEIAEVLAILAPNHDGRDFEPECPACTAYQKLFAAEKSA